MPTFDLYLPPRAHSVWRPRRSPNSLAAVSTLITAWIERARQRRALADLDDHMLRDIGVTRVDAAREAYKPFWR